MDTVKYKGSEIHVRCGGTVIKGICVLCGERKPEKDLMTKIFGDGSLIMENKVKEFNREEHRRRIRSKRDIRA